MTGLAELLDAPGPRGLDDLGGRWDQALMVGCRHFALLGNAEKQSVRRAIMRDHDRSWALIGWVEGLATLGVRAGSRDVLVFGLIGLSLFDQDAVDTRDAEVVYALVVRAAELIGEAPREVVELAAAQTDPLGREWLVDRMPGGSPGVPPTHNEAGEGDNFAFRRREANRDPEVDLADFLDES